MVLRNASDLPAEIRNTKADTPQRLSCSCSRSLHCCINDSFGCIGPCVANFSQEARYILVKVLQPDWNTFNREQESFGCIGLSVANFSQEARYIHVKVLQPGWNTFNREQTDGSAVTLLLKLKHPSNSVQSLHQNLQVMCCVLNCDNYLPENM